MRTRRTVPGFLASVSILIAATLASAQPPARPTPTRGPVVVQGGIDLVQVDAVVTDGKGHVVDLKAEDFEILEDGRPQRITNCEYVVTHVAEDKTSAPRPVPTNAGTLKREDVKRSMAIVVDDLTLAFEDVHTVRDGLKKFIDELQPGDLVAIVRTSGGMGILQQFTTDKEILRAAVNQVRFNGLSAGGATAGETAAALTIGADTMGASETDALARMAEASW